MNCPRCYTTLADTATFCPHCGTTVRPVSSTTFSYLPSGTPAWPNTQTQRPTYTDNAVSSLQYRDSIHKGEQKNKRKTSGTLLIVAILILAPLLGILLTLGILHANGQFPLTTSSPSSATPGTANAATPVATSTAGPSGNQLPTPTSFQKLTTISSTLGVTLNYPSNWVASTPQSSTNYNTVELSQSQSSIQFSVTRYSSQFSTSIPNADTINQGILQSLSSQSNVSNLQLVQPSTPQRTIGGMPWTELDALLTDTSGNQVQVLTISVQHNKFYYNLLIFIPQSIYSEAMQKYIQPIFDSFKFAA